MTITFAQVNRTFGAINTMMRNLNISTEVTVSRDELLAKLQTNLSEHKTIVQEARAGFVKQARSLLSAELDRFADGKARDLKVVLSAPQDMSEAYRTAIAMMKMHTGETVTLGASEFRCLVLDEWDWSSQFLTSNSMYSQSAVRKLASSDDD